LSFLLRPARLREPTGIAAAWFLIALTPTALVPLRDILAEHRAYLPLAGLALAGGVGLSAASGWSGGRRCGLLIAGGCLLALTWQRNLDYATEERLWRDTAAKSPGKARPHNNYGVALLDKGDLAGARREFDLARRLDPDYHDAIFNLAVALEQSGRREQAIQVLEAAIKRFRYSSKMITNLGLLRLQQGDRKEARRLLLSAAGRPHGDARAASNLARMYIEEGRPELADQWADLAIRRNPELEAAFLNRAVIARMLGRLDRARADLERARALRPDLPEIVLEQGHLSAARGDWNGAIERYRSVLARRPNHVPALLALAQAYHALGREREARAAWIQARAAAAPGPR
jgi:Flp pilus assembly protein TadD